MENIVFTRIDNRLVHGQVGVTWTTSVNANLLVVADDEVANDKVQQSLMTITAKTADVGIRFFSIQKTINTIHKASPKQKIFLVVRTPQDIVRLLEGNVAIKSVNVGNMHFSEGKEKISAKVYVDQSDRDAFEKIKAHGVDLYIQDVPDSEKIKL